MIFDELPGFTKRATGLLDDQSLFDLQVALVRNPEQGKVIPNSRGLRKLRWALPGRGKSGGVRVIYYWWTANEKITLCDIYAKNEKENLSPREVESLRKQLDG